jgi:Cysteine rich repeat
MTPAACPLLIVGAIACTALTGPANAQALPPEANNPAVQAAAEICKGDIAKFCPTVVPGGGRIVRCLVANKENVSVPCVDAILKAKTALGR